ncbi:MAG: DUF892 family protein [Planctomycetota bacterium]|nr:DUF892 family protein [Planctomycetota bacterium]
MYIETERMLFAKDLQVLYSVETQLVLALPRVAMRVSSPTLRDAILHHLEQTKTHAARLVEIASILGFACHGLQSAGMHGILREGDEAMGYGGPEAIVDEAIIAACQKVEAYEISAYRAFMRLAHRVAAEHAQVGELLSKTLDEEEEANRSLSDIAIRAGHVEAHAA